MAAALQARNSSGVFFWRISIPLLIYCAYCSFKDAGKGKEGLEEKRLRKGCVKEVKTRKGGGGRVAEQGK